MDFLDFLDKENTDPLPPLRPKRERSVQPEVGWNSSATSTPQRPRVEGKLTAFAAELTLQRDVSDKLYPYQRDGVAWLYERHKGGCGCVLADEMGLGKTVQVATFLGGMMRADYLKTVLIVVPGTLLQIWQDALMNWGGLPPVVVEVVHKGTKAARVKRWQRFRFGTSFVAITTYGILKSDSDELRKITIDYAVLDEAHLIKDSSSEAFKSAKAIQAIHRIGITGTPLMNNYNELWALMNFADENILQYNRADFSAINNDIQRGNERDATGNERSAGKQAIDTLRSKTKLFMLRREKKSLDVSLGKKSEYVLWVRMNSDQASQYRSFLESDTVQVVLRSINTSQLVLLTALKRICDHPWLNFNERNFLEAMTHPNTPSSDFADFGDIGSGPKLSISLKLITEHTNQGLRTVVFSRSKRLLHMLGYLLSQNNVTYCHFDGDTAMNERSALISKFNEGNTSVCLATTQVGGVGVTFTGATRVILLDPSWNPAADAQAVDRVHRIGQTSDVIIYRLITAGTVDEKVYRNQIFKMMSSLQISAETEEGATNVHRYFTHTQLRNMFELKDSEGCETATQLQEIHPKSVDPEVRSRLQNSLGDALMDISSHSAIFTLSESNDSAPTRRPPKPKAPRKRTPTPPPTSAEQLESMDLLISPTQLIDLPTTINPILTVNTEVPTLPTERIDKPRCTIFASNNSGAIQTKDCEDALVMVRGIKFARIHMSEVHRGSIALDINDYMLDSDLEGVEEETPEDSYQVEVEMPRCETSDSARISGVAEE